MAIRALLSTILGILVATAAWADEDTIALKPAPGADVVTQSCSGCHSLDYIQMNAPFLSADGWKAEVGKMRAAYGAAVDDADAAVIVKYLADSYGTAGK